jgi:hypothetical protein
MKERTPLMLLIEDGTRQRRTSIACLSLTVTTTLRHGITYTATPVATRTRSSQLAEPPENSQTIFLHYCTQCTGIAMDSPWACSKCPWTSRNFSQPLYSALVCDTSSMLLRIIPLYGCAAICYSRKSKIRKVGIGSASFPTCLNFLHFYQSLR